MKCIIFSNSYNRLNILQKNLKKNDSTQFILIDDINLLTDLISTSKNDSLYLILDFEKEEIGSIRNFSYECIKLKDDIKCVLLPAKNFNISHQKIGLVHFVRKGITVNSFDELLIKATDDFM